MALDEYRDMLDQKRVSVGGNRGNERPSLKTSAQRRFIQKQMDKGRYQSRGRSRSR